MPPKRIGQGSLELPNMETAPVVPKFSWEDQVAISSVLKYLSDVRHPDPGLVSERDVRAMTPRQIERGIYVPFGDSDRSVEHARGGVVFPAEEYSLLTKSPVHVANAANTGVWRRRRDMPNKDSVRQAAGRASGHALQTMLDRSEQLAGALRTEEDALGTVNRELLGAGGTGWYRHHKAENLRLMVTSAETAIFRALDVAAISLEWDEEKHGRAKSALNYQLWGDHPNRYKNWKAYTGMAGDYAMRRRKIVENTQIPIRTELAKYQPYLDDE